MRIHKEFFKYVLPSMMAFALSGVYAIADGFFVGNALGDNALAAINIAYPLTAFLQAAGTGIGMGGAVQYALNLGNEDKKRSQQYFGMSVLLLFILGIFLTFFLLILSPKILQLFGAEKDVFILSNEYIRFIAYGAIFQIMGTGLVPFIRNMGSSFAAMCAMITGFITNIVLDYTFVWLFPFGMAGAAVATVIGQGMTVLVCILFLVKKKKMPLISFGKNSLFFAKRIIAVGLSPFGLTFSPNITLILLNKSAIIYGGSSAVTSYAVISYISCIVILLLQGITDGGQPLISMSYGKGYIARTKFFKNMCYQFAAFTAVICMTILFLFRTHAAELFGASEQISEDVAQILPIFILGFLFVSFSRTSTSYFYATEKNFLAYILIYGESAVLFLLLMVLPKVMSIKGTWISVPISQIFIMILSAFFIIKTEKKNIFKRKTAK